MNRQLDNGRDSSPALSCHCPRFVRALTQLQGVNGCGSKVVTLEQSTGTGRTASQIFCDLYVYARG